MRCLFAKAARVLVAGVYGGLLLAATSLSFGDPSKPAPSIYRPARYKSYADAAGDWHAHATQCTTLNARIPQKQATFNDAQGALLGNQGALRAKIDALVAEKAQGMDEFRRGLRCSKCNGTQTQLGGPAAFRAHLGKVNGDPVPPTPQEIADKEKEYDDKINEVVRTLRELVDRAARAEQELSDTQNQRQTECERAASARAAAIQLKALESSRQETGDKGPWRCEAFPAETKKRIDEADAKLAQLDKETADERTAAAKDRAERRKLEQQLAAESDANRRQILQQAINARRISEALHDQQVTRLGQRASQVTADRKSLSDCLDRAQ